MSFPIIIWCLQVHGWAPLAIVLIAVFAVLILVLFCAIFCKRKNDSDFRYCLAFCFEKHHCCCKQNKNQCPDLSEGITDSLTTSTLVENGSEIIYTPVSNTEVMIVNNGIHPGTRNNGIHPGPRNNDMHTGPRNNEIHPGLGNNAMHPDPATNEIHSGPRNIEIHAGTRNNAMHPGPATNEIHPGPRNIEIHAGTRNNTMHPGLGTNEIHPGPVKVSSFDPHALPPSYEEATVLDLFAHLHPTAPPLHS